jgi:hypothetical protein
MGFGENRDSRGRQVREDIHGRPKRNKSAIHQQTQGGDHDDQPVVEGPLDDFVQHGFLHFV